MMGRMIGVLGLIALFSLGCDEGENTSPADGVDVAVGGTPEAAVGGVPEAVVGGVPEVEEGIVSDATESPEDPDDTSTGPVLDGEGGTTSPDEDSETTTALEELPPCLATGTGFVTLDSGGSNTIIEYKESVTVEGSHLEPGGCLTGLTLTWSRAEGCGLTLVFAPSLDGIWQLEEASLGTGAACGEGGTGTGTGTLSGVPLMTSSSPPPHRCTVLLEGIFAHGEVQGAAWNLNLEGLGLEGMLFSTAVETGTCGEPYAPCPTQECGVDPLLQLSCGKCAEDAICENGSCKTVEPVIAFCQRILDDRAELFEGSWGGSSATCDPGTMDLDWQERALKSTNLYRWVAGQPPLSLDAAANPSLQECAVMMDAGGSLSHSPGETWPCYTGAGAGGAGVSNLAGVAAVNAVDLYMADPGNATTIGHRRWILSDWIGITGFGSTNGWSCMQVVGGYGGFGGSASWIAWPAPGIYPMELHYVAYQTVDYTGWTIQTNGISINDATVQVTENGLEKTVDVMLLAGNYGSGGALKITPVGWKIQAGSSYEVTVLGASEDIQYSFDAVDCSEVMGQ